MDHNTIFTIIILVIVLDFLLGKILEYLNYRKFDDKLPPEVRDVYDQKEYRRSQQYKKVNYRFTGITSLFSFLLILGMLFLEGFAFVDHLARSITGHPVLTGIVFFGILFFVSDILNTPFAIYDTFVIEEKFGFNKTKPKTFILDKIKSWLLAVILGVPILGAIIWFYQKTTDHFWIYAWALVAAFSIFMTMFYSNLIVPLFNKQTPLKEGELRESIEKFSDRAGFALKNIYVIDGSKRSTKSNAYFSGLGKKKRIVLFDTLIEELENNEILAVLAHEIGHYKKKHTLTSVILSIFQTGLLFFLLSLVVGSPGLSKALGTETPSFHIGVVGFGILYSPVSMVIGLLMNFYSRKNEYAADRFAGKRIDTGALINALKKLSRKNLSNLTPHPAYVFFNYSHPPLVQRIRALKRIEG